MREIPLKLFENLDQQGKTHQKLLSALTHELGLKPSFNSEDLTTLENLQQKKYQVLDKLKELDSDLAQIIDAIGAEWGITEKPTIWDLIDASQQSDAQRLKKQREELMGSIDKISDLSQRTAEKSNARLKPIKQLNENISGIRDFSSTYVLSGKLKKLAQARIISRSI